MPRLAHTEILSDMKTPEWTELLMGGPDSAGARSISHRDAQVFFEPGDEVEFCGRDGIKLTGAVAKLNPKNAVIRVNGGDWNVPYRRLDHHCPETASARRPRAARLRETAHLARKLMDRHGLKDWELGFSAAKTRLGSCDSGRKIIRLSLKHAAGSPEGEVKDTILHEIAHALAGPAARHGPEWKAVASRLGATPKSCAQESEETQRKMESAKSGFRVGDAVSFAARGMIHKGRITRMNPKRARIETPDSFWSVPYLRLNRCEISAAEDAFSQTAVSSESEMGRFRVGAAVTFYAKGKRRSGVIVRTNSQHADVLCRDFTAWGVPISYLS